MEVAKVHEDLDQPGSKAERPGLEAAMRRAKRGTVSGLVVWRLDRFGRSAVHNARLLDELRAAGAALYTVSEGIDTSSGPMGEFMANIFTAFAQLELARISQNWSAARERAVARGVHIASRSPTGYVAGEEGVLTPDPRAADAIRRVFEAKASGASWAELGRILEQAGVKTPYGGERWTNRSLTHLLSNRVYLGEARSGEFVNESAHSALVDEDTWRLAQRPAGKRSTGEGALLSGLARCAGCRYILKHDNMTSHGKRLTIYRCRGHRAMGTCADRASSLSRVIEPFVVERFFEGLGDVLAEAVRVAGDYRELEARLDRAQAELVAYRDSGAAAVLGDAFLDGLVIRQGKVDAAREALDAVRDSAVDLPDAPTLRGVWDELSVRQRRHALAAGIDAVFLRSGKGLPIAERVHIFWRGEAPSDLPGVGRRVGPIRPLDWPR
jgi:DNA invertase Pin-like site-specific DNA recombinase